jgi:predicted phage terminase large subunit-like protein
LTIWGVFSGDIVAQNMKQVGGGADRRFTESHPRVMMMYAWQGRYELHDLVAKVSQTCAEMKVDSLLIENKAAGHSVAQEIRRLYGHEKFGVQLVDPKGQDKLARLYSVQHIFAEGMIYAPYMAWSEMVITQVGQFPKGKHDDLVDTVSMAIRHLRDIGVLVRGAEWAADAEEQLQFRGNSFVPLYPI